MTIVYASECVYLASYLFIFLLLFALTSHGGIPGLSKYMRSHYKSCYKKIPGYIKSGLPLEVEVDHLCVDMNQLLYGGSKVNVDHTSSSYIKFLFSRIDDIVTLVKPKKSIVLAFDGTAPFAKMLTQRSRRRSSLSNSMATPGTHFMNAMSDIVLCYALQRTNRMVVGSNITFFLSKPKSPGEGELKIVDWIINKSSNISNDIINNYNYQLNSSHVNNSYTTSNYSSDYYTASYISTYLSNYPSINESYIIYGSDSDLLVQSLGLINYNNIFILQSLESNKLLCNISMLVQVMHKEVSKNVLIEKNIFRYDLSILMMFLGNDYLPKLSRLRISNLLTSYRRVMSKLDREDRYLYHPIDKSFHTKVLYLIMKELNEDNESIGIDELSFHLAELLPNPKQWLTDKVLIPGNISITESDSYDDINRKYGFSLSTHLFNISVDNNFISKKAAKQMASYEALKACDLAVYQSFAYEFIAKTKQARRLVDVIHNSTIKEVYDLILSDIQSNGLVDDLDDDFDDEDTDSFNQLSTNSFNNSAVVKKYLEGILWTHSMYQRGVCPDISYTYNGYSVPSAANVMRYLEETLNDDINCSRILSNRFISTPVSKCRALSASANCVCVIPAFGVEYVPRYLKRIWIRMLDSYSYLLDEPNLPNDLSMLSYDKMIESLATIWSNSSSVSTSEITFKSSHNKRYKKSKDRTINNEVVEEMFASSDDCMWTVIAALHTTNYSKPISDLVKRMGYAGEYLTGVMPDYNSLPFPIKQPISSHVALLHTPLANYPNE